LLLPELDNLVRIGKLKAEPPAANELAGLLRSGRVRLADAEREVLNIESRFDLAYNASHGLALAALRSCGYRSDKRYLVFECLEYSSALDPDQIRVFVKSHKHRNLAEYEGNFVEDEELLVKLIQVAQHLLAELKDMTMPPIAPLD